MREKLLDDTMSWDSGERAVSRIVENCMLFPLAPQHTAMRFEMADQILTVHLCCVQRQLFAGNAGFAG